MVLKFLEWLVSPIIWMMEHILSVYISLTASVGLSIIFLSITMTVIFLPLRRKARRVELSIASRSSSVAKEVQSIDRNLSGELRFRKIEDIYAKHDYHPIQDLLQGLSAFYMLPVLLSAVFLFSDTTTVKEKTFLLIQDLSEPDGLLSGINILPLLMTGITIADARIRFHADRATRFKFFAVAAVLLVLVYNMSAALVLYWITSNVLAFVMVLRTDQRPQLE